MVVLFLDQWFSSGLAGKGLPPEYVWQCQETFLVVPAGEILLIFST